MNGTVKVSDRSSRRRMAKSSLAILERAFRGGLEEQYGHILWLSRIMKAMGAPTSVMLKGDAVCYALGAQKRQSIIVGDRRVSGISHHASGAMALIRDQVPLFVWAPDAERLGLQVGEFVDGVQLVDEADWPSLVIRHDCVWYW